MTVYLLTAFDSRGAVVQYSVELDPADPATANALRCVTKASAQLHFRGVLAGR